MTPKTPKKPRGKAPTQLERPLMERLMFGSGRVRRFTQDTPVLPDVWLAYANCLGDEARAAGEDGDPFPPLKLLLTPYRDTQVGDLRNRLRERLRSERGTRPWRAFGHGDEPLPRVVYNQTTIAATLHFEDLVRAVLPLTEWWMRIAAGWNMEGLEGVVDEIAEAVRNPEHPPEVPTGKGERRRPPPGLLWMIRVVGALALVHRGKPLPRGFRATDDTTSRQWRPIVAAVAELIRDVNPAGERAAIHSVSLNREVSPTISKSTLAVKADAARLLFNISCKDLTWAVIDAGLDARHPAFRLREEQQPLPQPFEDETGAPANQTRVLETYDFTQIDVLLDPDTQDQPGALAKRLEADGEVDAEQAKATLEDTLHDLNSALVNGRALDWGLVEPLLRVPHEEGKYSPPGNDHGTHVAGILAGDWPAKDSNGELEEDLVGVCPDLRLYDLRVLDASGRGDEFGVMAALQFIRYLNATHDFVVIHGVNLSLSIPHDVANYACGRTPVCEECERVVSSGVVVVAAAGNQGYRRYATAEGSAAEAYNSSSITDPGNAETVITVGATHRYRPHVYGVSYFSSRGPTGDGRAKPDLVAPGEKITAPLPEGLYGVKDGTSMAAPHVSGGAALLMARHNELVGRPVRIKEILCRTATDLGRERYFQGAGMLDILRALQAV